VARFEISSCTGGLLLRQLETTDSVSGAAEQALTRAYIACKLALESLDELPTETVEAVEEPVREFCRRLEPFVGHLVDEADASGPGR
jgi:hypothetical protein